MTPQPLNRPCGVDVLAKALFAAYSRNSGNPPECHYDRNAAEQWMAQALTECGVAELIAVANRMDERGFFDDVPYSPDPDLMAMKAALAAVEGQP